ncbi:hypothetical protein V6N13_098760 [Hibiscus sabdariffa]
MTSVRSTLRIYSLRVQPVCRSVNLSFGRVGTGVHRQRAEMMHGKARMPLSFWQASDSSLAITSPTLNLKPEMMALINQPCTINCLVV